MIELRRRNNKVADTPSYSRLPKGYQEVEYLESTSSTGLCIMIPITILETSSIELHLKYNSYNDIYQANGWADGAQMTINRSGVWHTTNVTAKIGQKYINTIEIDDLGYWEFFIDGELKSSNTSNSNTYFMYLFAASEPGSGGVASYKCNESIYYSKIILKNGTIIELIPCYRISDRVAGMYDIVNDVFYTNAGEGEFLVGADVHYNIPPEYQQVEYLESTGTQYIVTDIPANDGTDVTIDFQLKTAYQPRCVVFGGRSIVPERWYLYIQTETQWNFGHGGGKMVNISTGGDRHIVNYITSNDKRVEIDGVRVKSFTSQIKTELGIYIFYANNPANESMHPCIAKVFSFKAKDTIANKDYYFIPCYNKKTLIEGMYDVVNDIFYTNAGTGSFIVGPDVIG